MVRLLLLVETVLVRLARLNLALRVLKENMLLKSRESSSSVLSKSKTK